MKQSSQSLPQFALLIFLLPGMACATGTPDPSESTSLTIYSSAQPGAIAPEAYRSGGPKQPVPGYALVKQERELSLEKGRNTIRFADVSGEIDPTTVAFESLTDPDNTRVVEQNFQFDLVSTEKLLEKYIDREIQVEQSHGNSTETIAGVLTSTTGGFVLKATDGAVRIINGYSGVRLPSLPGGLISKPTLVWNITAQKPGAHRTRVTYQTGGITWWADYNLTYSDGTAGNTCKLDVGAWVSILNQSGASYNDAKLKLVAGDVQRAQPLRPVPRSVMQKPLEAAAPPTFEEKPFFEYHLYTLGFPTTIPDNSAKQVELFPDAHGVQCEKVLVYAGQLHRGPYGAPLVERAAGLEFNRKVDVRLTFGNSKENHLGIPLPAGRIRVSKLDPADRSLEFIGEDVIDHTPRDEKVHIKLGSAFDVVGERRQVDFRVDTTKKVMEEDIEIKLRNQKDEAVTVMVKENLYRWSQWEILRPSQPFEKQDAATINFSVRVGKGAEAVVRYTARYTW